MAAEACRAAVVDAGVDLADVDGMICFEAGDSVGPLAVSSAIGLRELAWNIDTMGGGNVVANVIATAGAAIDAGLCRAVLVYRSLNGRSGHRFGTATGRLEVGGDLQFEAPHGYLVPPQWIAMWARRHQHVYGSTCEDLGQIAITQTCPRGTQPARHQPHAALDRRLPGRPLGERAVPDLRLRV
jgi:acetyl-CoA acetyltransferase